MHICTYKCETINSYYALVHYLRLLRPVLRCGLLSYPNCCTPWIDILDCVNHHGKQHLLKEQFGLGTSARPGPRFRGRILAPHIPPGSVYCSSVAGVLGNTITTLGDPTMPTFTYLRYLHTNLGLSYVTYV
jgi:hypothetical protein